MVGQGSPLTAIVLWARRTVRRRSQGRLGLRLAVLCCALLGAAPSPAKDVNLRLWIAWGGGAARQWQGQICLEGDPASGAANELTAAVIRQKQRLGDPTSGVAVGSFSELEPIGLQADASGAAYVERDTLYLTPRSPRSYDGLTVLVTGPRTASLVIQLTPLDQRDQGRRVRIPLEQLITEVHNSVLDDRGNRLLVRRTAGDKVRIRFSRDSLVFAPGEKFDLSIDPYLIEVESGTSLSYGVQVLRARTSERLWEDHREATVDARGDPPEVGPFSIPLPREEGAYDIQLTLNRRRLPTRLAPAKLLYQRIVQVLVVDTKPAVASSVAWKPVTETLPQIEEVVSEAAHGKAKLPLPKLPQWKWIPGSGADHAKQKPLGNGKSRKRTHPDGELVELQPGGWQAYPLLISQVNHPHLLEVEYPSDCRQTLGLSILDPNAAGLIAPPELDSGLDVPTVSALTPSRLERHRVVFWPRTATPLLLLTNHREDMPAVFGRIRVLAGPAELPSRSTLASESARLLGVYYERPLFTDNFSASDTLDAITGRNLNDWVTFQQGGSRLVQHLRHSNLNGAMLSVLHEGSAIYPSRTLESVPRYDNGVFFSNAQDPLRKDVLEMLFRMFDREGLKLVPALQFSAPLPELEAALRQSVPLWRSPGIGGGPSEPGSVGGVELIGADGKSWRETFGADRSSGAFYNPLDPRVQQALRRVVQEVVDRYGQHPAFSGLAIQLGPHTYAQLPDADWGYDPTTIARFAQEQRLAVPGLSAGDFEQVAAFLETDGRERWLKWRAHELARFYQQLANDVSSKVRGAKLYLAGADMFSSAEMQQQLQPRLPERLDIERLLLRVGFDPQEYGQDSGVVLLRPHRLAPLTSLESQAANLALDRAPEMEAAFGLISTTATGAAAGSILRRTTGSVFQHEPRQLSLPAFDRVSPFGAEKTHTRLFSQFSPAGAQNRQRFAHSLATLDSQAMFDGGWMALVGQQDALLDFADIYRRLPDEHFQTVLPKNADVKQPPVVVRKLARGNRTFLYVVNDSAWPLTISIELAASRPFGCESLGSRPVPALAVHGNQAAWEVALQPYDLVGVSFSASDVEVLDWRVTVGRDVLVELRKGIDDLRRRANLLKDPAPLNALSNPGFELPAQTDQLAGWDYARASGTTVQIDPKQNHSGQNSLRVQSAGPVVWVRSNPFPVPKTGRLSVWVWLKIARPEDQPPLRLAIEGRLNGQTYYRPAEVGAKVGVGNPPPLTNTWAPYLLRIDNLPVEGLTDLRVAFDLMGKGEVWIDDVQVFDLWFDKTERNELVKQIGLANYYLGNGDVAQCSRIVDGYWSEFLRRHVAADPTQLADAPREPPADEPKAPTSGSPTAEKPKASTSWLQRIVPKPPKVPNVFR